MVHQVNKALTHMTHIALPSATKKFEKTHLAFRKASESNELPLVTFYVLFACPENEVFHRMQDTVVEISKWRPGLLVFPSCLDRGLKTNHIALTTEPSTPFTSFAVLKYAQRYVRLLR